jgi:hypothetical protein
VSVGSSSRVGSGPVEPPRMSLRRRPRSRRRGPHPRPG